MSRLFRDVEGGTLFPHGSVVCIGAFDGLHLGHQALVRHAVERARALGVPAVAVSFEPLPREFFANDTPPPRLTLARAKIEGLYGFGADSVGMIRFDGRLSAMSAQDFVRLALVGRLCAREVWIGPEFRFGHRRGGDIALLRALGEQHGFAAGEIAPVHLRGERISATRIRELLVAGEFAHAGELRRPPVRNRWTCGPRQAAWPHVSIPPPICGLPAPRRCPVSMPPGCMAWPRTHGRRSPASARGPRLRGSSPCWKRTCSIFRATCTGATSRSNSSPSYAMKKSLMAWKR